MKARSPSYSMWSGVSKNRGDDEEYSSNKTFRFTHDGNYIIAIGSDRLINMWSCKQENLKTKTPVRGIFSFFF